MELSPVPRPGDGMARLGDPGIGANDRSPVAGAVGGVDPDGSVGWALHPRRRPGGPLSQRRGGRDVAHCGALRTRRRALRLRIQYMGRIPPRQ